MQTLGKHSPRFKAWCRLGDARARREQRLTLAEGPEVVAELLASSWEVEAVLVEAGRHPHLERQAQGRAELLALEPQQLSRLTSAQTSQGVVAIARPPETRVHLADVDFALLLEDLHDPGNLGALARTARAAAVQALVVTGGTDPYGPKALRAAAGALFHLPVTRLEDPLEVLKAGPELVCAVARGGQPLFEAKLEGRIAIALGNEKRGLSDQLLTAATRLVTIPMAGGCESLNVAVSGALLMYERVRRCG
ncbi:MAG: TrmH family RNA methyltransferase [Vulcanimicrobiota bacterium]